MYWMLDALPAVSLVSVRSSEACQTRGIDMTTCDLLCQTVKEHTSLLVNVYMCMTPECADLTYVTLRPTLCLLYYSYLLMHVHIYG